MRCDQWAQLTHQKLTNYKDKNQQQKPEYKQYLNVNKDTTTENIKVTSVKNKKQFFFFNRRK